MNAPVGREQWAELRRAALSAMPEVVETVGLPAALLPYQQRTVARLEAATRVLFVEKSRRIGLTWALAAYAVLRAARQRKAGGMDAMYISYSQEMTREFVDACAMWARVFSLAAAAAEECLFDDGEDGAEGGTRSIQAFRIRFASGFEVLGLSSAPRTLRGKQGLVIVDEAAFVESLKELLKAALAFLMWGGQVVVCSTHDGAENEFNVQVRDILAGRSKYAHLRIDFDQALQDGLYQRIALVTGQAWSPEVEAAWRQDIIDFYGDGADEELFCVPALGSGAWLPGPLIEARMTADCPVLRWELPADFLHRTPLARQAMVAAFLDQVREALDGLDKKSLYGLGFDFARVADLSVVWLFRLGKRLRRETALVVEMRRIPHNEQAQVTRMIMRALRLLGAAFDATGAGEWVAEQMQREFGIAGVDGEGGGLVAAIKLTQEWYRTEMPPVKAAFEDDAISVPPDPEILADLRLVKVIRGIPMVPPVRTGEKGKRRHGDAAVAVVLAFFATRMRVTEFGYRPAVAAAESRATTWDRPDHHDDDDAPGSHWRQPLGARLRGSI